MGKKKEKNLAFGNRLRHFRDDVMRLTQPAFAERIGNGVSQASVSQWEGGIKPLPDTYELIFKAFPKLNREWLNDGIGEVWTTEKAVQKESDYTLLKLVEELMKEKARLLDLLEKALTTNANFPEDSSLVPTRQIGWTTIQPAA